MALTPAQRIARVALPIAGGAILVLFHTAAERFLGGAMLRCPVKWITGLSCPGCGSQRALKALLHGDLPGAIEVNLLLPFCVAYLLLLWVCHIWADKPAAIRINAAATSPAALLSLAAIILIWFILRNILGI